MNLLKSLSIIAALTLSATPSHAQFAPNPGRLWVSPESNGQICLNQAKASHAKALVRIDATERRELRAVGELSPELRGSAVQRILMQGRAARTLAKAELNRAVLDCPSLTVPQLVVPLSRMNAFVPAPKKPPKVTMGAGTRKIGCSGCGSVAGGQYDASNPIGGSVPLYDKPDGSIVGKLPNRSLVNVTEWQGGVWAKLHCGRWTKGTWLKAV
jgi:hypothetical protein